MSSTIKVRELVRDALNRRGLDIRVYRPFWDLIPKFRFDVVFDVGANRGQFAMTLRRLGYKGQIVSFEPQKAVSEELQKLCEHDGNWTMHRMALGASPGTLPLRVYECDDFSSFFRLQGKGPRQIGVEHVEVQTFDQAAAPYLARSQRSLLKIDTQGYEREVLSGAARSLPSVQALLLEVSLVAHYDGQWLLEDAFRFCRNEGFVPYTMRSGYFEGDQDVEYDVLFLRDGLDTATWAAH